MLIPLSYSLRSLFTRRTTTIAAAAGIGLVVFVLASSMMLAEGIRDTMASSGTNDKALVLRKGSDSELASGIDQKNVNLILAAPGVKRTSEGKPMGAGEVVVVAALDKLGTDGKFSNVQVRGVQAMSYELRNGFRIVDGRPAKPGTDEGVVGTNIRGRYAGLELGGSFDLKKNRPVRIVGVFDTGGSAFDSEVWVDVDTLRSSFGREGLVSSVTVQLESASKYDGFAATVESDKQLGFESFRERDYYDKQSEGTSMFVTGLGFAVAFFFSLGAMIGAMITMYAAVSQREREIGTLQALGFSRLAILISFLFESVCLALLGGAVGGLASLAMGLVRLSMMNFATWQEISFSFDPTGPIIVGSVLAGAVMGILGGILPAIRAARTSPVQAMRG